MRIGPSNIREAGHGLISETFISAHTWLGVYDGEIVPRDKSSEISWYTWTVSTLFIIIPFNWSLFHLII